MKQRVTDERAMHDIEFIPTKESGLLTHIIKGKNGKEYHGDGNYNITTRGNTQMVNFYIHIAEVSGDFTISGLPFEIKEIKKWK